MNIVFVTCISRNKSIFWPIFIEYNRLSQIACTVMIMHITCTQCYMCTTICACYWFLYVEMIWICQCALFFLPHAWLPPSLIHHVAMLATSLRCANFVCLFVFTENDFVAKPKTRYILINLKAGLHSFYFADGKNIIE